MRFTKSLSMPIYWNLVSHWVIRCMVVIHHLEVAREGSDLALSVKFVDVLDTSLRGTITDIIGTMMACHQWIACSIGPIVLVKVWSVVYSSASLLSCRLWGFLRWCRKVVLMGSLTGSFMRRIPPTCIIGFLTLLLIVMIRQVGLLGPTVGKSH